MKQGPRGRSQLPSVSDTPHCRRIALTFDTRLGSTNPRVSPRSLFPV
jgi:hypothetical protein